MKQDIATLAPSFVLPAPGNDITSDDIGDSKLRITVGFKKYFPKDHCDMIIVVRDELHTARFIYQERRSYVLRIGKKAMKLLGLKAGGQVHITKLGPRAYHLKNL